MLLEKIKLTDKDLKPFLFEWSSPDLIDDVDFSENYGTIKKNGVEIECVNNKLVITIDFEIDYKVTTSIGDYYTPSFTEVYFHTPIIWDWYITDEDGDEVELDTLAETRLELALIEILKDQYR